MSNETVWIVFDETIRAASMMELLSANYNTQPICRSPMGSVLFAPLAMVAHGARIIERHFTLDKVLNGFDHHLSLEPEEFARMVKDIEELTAVMKGPDISELDRDVQIITRNKYHVSIVSAAAIPAGTVIAEDMLTLKNPGTGIPARHMGQVTGKTAIVDIPADVLIEWEMVS